MRSGDPAEGRDVPDPEPVWSDGQWKVGMSRISLQDPGGFGEQQESLQATAIEQLDAASLTQRETVRLGEEVQPPAAFLPPPFKTVPAGGPFGEGEFRLLWRCRPGSHRPR